MAIYRHIRDIVGCEESCGMPVTCSMARYKGNASLLVHLHDTIRSFIIDWNRVVNTKILLSLPPPVPEFQHWLHCSSDTLDDKELSPNFRCEILQIFRKIFCSIPPDLPGVDMAEFLGLVLIVKSAAQSSFKEQRHLAIYLLVNIFCGLRRKIREYWSSFPEKWDAVFSEFQRSDGHRDGSELIVYDVILLIINEINFLVKQLNFEPSGALSRSKQEFTRLLNLILHLIYEYPSLSNVVLDRLRCLIETLVSVEVTFNMKTAVACGGVFQAEIGAEKLESILHPHEKGNKKQKPVVSELILCIC